MTVTDQDSTFAGRLRPGRRPAVLVIDMMRAYYTHGSPFCLPSRASVDAAAAVLDAARQAGVPVIHTLVSYSQEDLDSLVFLRKIPALRALAEGAALGEPMPEVAPHDGEVVLVKQQASAFYDTDLTEQLRRSGVDTVVIVGVSTSGCVRATAVDAVQRNLIPLVVREAVGDRTASVHDATLFDLQAKYAEVIGLDDALRLLRGQGPGPDAPAS